MHEVLGSERHTIEPREYKTEAESNIMESGGIERKPVGNIYTPASDYHEFSAQPQARITDFSAVDPAYPYGAAEADSSPVWEKDGVTRFGGVEDRAEGQTGNKEAEKEARISALQAKLEMVRKDKERLSRIAELERLEEELKAEVIKEMRSL
jgi:hypothetical protein